MELFLQKYLDLAKKNDLQRNLHINDGVDFYSNDYLGFGRDESLRINILKRLEAHKDITITGATGSRLLSGHHSLFQTVEDKLSIFSGTQSSTFFPSGYQANISLLSSIARKGDVIFSDELNHASIIDGARLSYADKEIFKHNCFDDLEEKLLKYKDIKGNKFIICESIYSMEGDQAPLKEISNIAQNYNAYFIVDESHSTGLFGTKGSGLVNQLGIRDQVFCTIHTAGKALGVSGAWIAGSKLLKEFLVNFSRGFIFSTAPSPIQFIMIEEALSFLKSNNHRSVKVLDRAEYLRNELKRLLADTKAKVLGTNTAIIPIVLNDNDVVLNIFNELKNININIAAIRPPTVKTGSSRLRLTVNYLNCEDELDKLLQILPNLIRRHI